MKNFLILLTGLLLSGMIAVGQTPASPKTQGQQQPPQKLTPEQEAKIIAQMQAQAKKLTIPQIKVELEKSPNPLLYTKQILQKRFKIDTIVVTKTRGFSSLADSLAYTGKIQKVYGPYGEKNNRFLVQLLTKAPNQFYHVSQIFIDTSVFRYHVADSLSDLILRKLKDGSSSFDQLARSYSMGGEAATKGDLGWIARGMLLMTIEHEVLDRKSVV